VGREFGWILEESIVLFYFLRSEIAQALAWRRVSRFFSKKLNVAALALVIIAGVAGYKYSMPRYRLYVERQYARQAEEYAAKRDLRRASLRVAQVLKINPDNPAATRVNADLADWVNSPYALYWRQRALVLAPSTTNRLALASTALKMERFPYLTATKALGEIQPEFRKTANYHLVAGALALKLNHLGEAEQHYAEAFKLQPDSPVARMSLAVLQLQSRNSNVVVGSRLTLELLNTEGKLGILPLRSLVAESASKRDFASAERISSQLLTNAQATFSDRMLHLTILHTAGRTNFQSFLKETQQKALERPVYIGEFAAWLNQSGFGAQTITWLRGLPRQTISQGLIPLALADAYVSLRKWKELESYLEEEPWVGIEHIRIATLSLAIRNQSDRERAGFSWDRAMRLASEDPGALNMLAQTALSWGWTPEAEQVLWRAATKFPEQPWPLTMLQNLYSVQRNTPGLWRVYQALMHRDPKDKLARNNFSMVSLLSGKELPAAHRYAEELYGAEPGNPIFASTYAFSRHLQGKTKEGLAVLRALKPEELADPGVSVYYGILLSAAGEVNASKDYLGKADKAILLPEEVALVASAKSLKINKGS
jgi:predicted Zn-dependent protease